MEYPPKIKKELLAKGIYLLTGEVSLTTTRKIFDWILSNRPDKKEFTIAIHSSGGSPGAVQEFYSLKRTLATDVKLTSVAFGECGSAALALYLACDKRIAVEGCSFWIHNLTNRTNMDCENTTVEEIQVTLQSSRDSHDELIRAQCKQSGITQKTWRKLAKRGSRHHYPIYCNEAKKLGIVTQIVDKYSLF